MRQFLLNFLVGLFKKKLIRDKYLIHHEVNEGLTNPWMKEARDKTWGRGGLPTLPGLYHSTIQPSRRGFF
jgi:hypothetical protein